MTLSRTLPGSTSGVVTGPNYMDAAKESVAGLWDRSLNTLTGVAGTNTITAALVPALTGSLIGGMGFFFTPVANNIGAATLNINSGGAVSIVRRDGTTLLADDLKTDEAVTLLYDGTLSKFRVMQNAPGAVGAKINRQVFTSDGTWTKPAGYSTDSVVIIELWAGGGGGGANTNGGGGGGGGYRERRMKLSDLSSTVAVDVGQGGAVNTGGSNSTFGSYLTAYGGGKGYDGGAASGGGGGGGALGQGSDGASSAGGVGGGPGRVLGSDGDSGGGSGGAAAGNDGRWSSTGGGGGGTGNNAGTGGAGGKSVYGGGGGGAGASGTDGGGGNSIHGGNGGDSGSAGSAPSGGGGRNAAGARGECRVIVIG